MSLLIGYNTNGFSHHRLLDALDVLAGLGYRSVGLTLDVHHATPATTDFGELRRELESRALLPVVETGARFLLDPSRKHHPTLLSASGASRRLEFYRRAVGIAAELGAPCVSLWSGRAEVDEPWGPLVAGLEEICERADAAGLDVAFEPEPGMFIDTMRRFGELRARLAHPRLRLTLDVGHVHCLEDDDPATVVARHADLLANVHLDDHRRGVHEHLFFGEGEIDFAPVLKALEAAAAQRDLAATVELSRHAHDAVKTARRARDALARWTRFQPPGPPGIR